MGRHWPFGANGYLVFGDVTCCQEDLAIPQCQNGSKWVKYLKLSSMPWNCFAIQLVEWIDSRWFKVTFWSPSWRSLNPLKGSLNHPKKVTLNHQVKVGNFSVKSASWFSPPAPVDTINCIALGPCRNRHWTMNCKRLMGFQPSKNSLKLGTVSMYT